MNEGSLRLRQRNDPDKDGYPRPQQLDEESGFGDVIPVIHVPTPTRRPSAWQSTPTIAPTTSQPTATAVPTTEQPTTMAPSTLPPTTLAPTTLTPTTTAPTSMAPTTATPTEAPTMAPHHHHSRSQDIEIDSSVILGFLAIVAIAILYRKRRRIPGYLMRIKYYLCCCRLSEQEILDQQEEHATLNDFLFEVEGNDDVGRVTNISHMSELTNDDGLRSEARMPTEVSIRSIFPDLLGEEMEKQSQTTSQHQSQQQSQPQTQQQTNSLEEPLLPQQQRQQQSN